MKNDSSSSTPAKKNYFASLSDRYSKASHILYMSLLVCFVLTLMFNSRVLTYNNFSYLLRDLDAAAELASESYNSISYTNNDSRVTRYFRGGVITASTNDVAIYTATGRKTLHINQSFVSPEIASSKKYAIVYDLGGNNYSIYNSFTKVHSNETDYPISYIAAADNGWYAVVSKDAEHSSVVCLYDNDFKLRATYSFAKGYVFSVSINGNGTRIAIISVSAGERGNEFSLRLKLCELGSSNVLCDEEISRGLPLGISFNGEGFLQVLCTDSICLFNEDDGVLYSRQIFDSNKIGKSSVNEYGCVTAFNSNDGGTSNTIIVFDKKGKMLYNEPIIGSVLDVEIYDKYLFVNQGDAILRVDLSNKRASGTPIYDKGEDIIVYNAGNVLLCCSTKAKYIDIGGN